MFSCYAVLISLSDPLNSPDLKCKLIISISSYSVLDFFLGAHSVRLKLDVTLPVLYVH